MHRSHRIFLLLFALVAVIALGAAAVSSLTPRIAVAQSGEDGDPGDPAKVSTGQSTSSEDTNGQAAPLAWYSSAEPPGPGPIEIISPPDSPSVTTDDAESPEGGLTSWRVIGSALRPRENDVSYTVNSDGGCIYATAGDAFTVWNTPIALPPGSTVDTLRMYYYDTSASNTTAWFTIYDLYGSIVDEWSVSSNTSGGNSFNDSVQINHVIDYSVYSYLINWRPIVTGSTMQLCGFRIFYTPPPFTGSYLPTINK